MLRQSSCYASNVVDVWRWLTALGEGVSFERESLNAIERRINIGLGMNELHVAA